MTTIAQELVPFSVPEYVSARMPPRPRQEGISFGPKYVLSDLSLQTLESLCADFRRNELIKAGKLVE